MWSSASFTLSTGVTCQNEEIHDNVYQMANNVVIKNHECISSKQTTNSVFSATVQVLRCFSFLRNGTSGAVWLSDFSGELLPPQWDQNREESSLRWVTTGTAEWRGSQSPSSIQNVGFDHRLEVERSTSLCCPEGQHQRTGWSCYKEPVQWMEKRHGVGKDKKRSLNTRQQQHSG